MTEPAAVERSGREPVYCYARSRQTGSQCRRRVRLPGELCRWHGGLTPVVQARQEVARAMGPSFKPAAMVDPLSAVQDVLGLANQVVGQLKVVAEQSGMATDAQLAQFGDWLDRLGRFSKLALDTKAVHAGFSEQQGRALQWVLEAVLTDLGHDVGLPDVRNVVHRRLVQIDEWLQAGHSGMPARDGAA